MNTEDLSEWQRLAIKILDDALLNPDLVVRQCPLDHGRHTLNPQFGLGSLDKLPIELQHEILGHVDVKSLFTFRRVSQSAMMTVNSVLEYQKILKHAASCIRMAFAIRQADCYTIKQLFAKLCQKTCDGPKCTKFAPYLDIFTLTRRCLSLGSAHTVDNMCATSITQINSHFWYQSHPLSPFSDIYELFGLRSFAPIKGVYGVNWAEPGKIKISTCDWAFCSVEEVREWCRCRGYEGKFEEMLAKGEHEPAYWRLCAVRAPWPSISGGDAEHGVFCPMCEDPEAEELDPAAMGDVDFDEVMQGMEYAYPDPTWIPFFSTEGLEAHMQKEHEKAWKVPKDPTISSNGKYVLYALNDKYKHPHCEFRASIWIANLGQADSTHRLTQGSFNDQSPQFAPGEGSITFLSDRHKAGDSCAIYKLYLNTDGIATSETPHLLRPPDSKRPIAQYSWSPKGDFLAYIVVEDETKEQKQREYTLKDAKVYGEDLSFGHLMCPTGKEILYTTTKSLERTSDGQYGVSFGRVNVVDGEINGICHFPGLMEDLAVWLDNKFLFRASTTPGNWERLLYGIDNDAALLAPIATRQLAAAVFQHRLYDHVVIFDATGSKQIISFDSDYVINAFSLIHINGVVNAAAIMPSSCSPWEVFSWTYKEGTKAENLSKLSTHSKELDETYSRVVQPFHCKATHGQALDGVLIRPLQSNFNEPKGTIINLHGGPYERSSFVFDPTLYCWAPPFVSLGYAVLRPNYRGGSGHEDESALATLGEMGSKDSQDIADIVHAAIDQNLIMADRTGSWLLVSVKVGS
ncbi:Nn.00g039550.m01.CDS01 [Neocucurbitaria sp. VM-36]